jgi:hypothetical protein
MGRSQSADSKPEISLLQPSRPSHALLFIVSIGRQQRPAGKPLQLRREPRSLYLVARNGHPVAIVGKADVALTLHFGSE